MKKQTRNILIAIAVIIWLVIIGAIIYNLSVIGTHNN